MKRLLVVYHSQSGTSARLARAALTGAGLEADVQTRQLRAWDASSADLARTDGLLLVCAENSGALSGGMKDFLDRVFYPSIAQDLLLPYALLISAGNDGRGAVRQAERILRGIPFTAVAQPLILRGEPSEDQLQQCRDLGQALAAGLAMGIY